MPRDEPLQTYYPAARVRLIVRLEDFGKATPAAPELPPQLRKGTKAKGVAQLQVVEQSDGSLLLLGPGDDPSQVGSPQDQAASSDNRTFAIEGIIPTSANLKRNGIRTADTLSIEIAFRDLPFDPTLLRGCGVQFFLGCISAEDFQRGIRGEKRSDATPSGAMRYNVVPDKFVDEYGRPRSNLRFEGWVDDYAVTWASSDAPTIALECTDNTRLVIDQDAPPGLTVGASDTIDKAIATYLSNFPQFRGISVAYKPAVAKEKIPKLSAVMGKTKFQPQLGPSPAGGGTSKLKVWDYLTDVAGALGHTIRFEGSTIIVQLPRTLYDTRFAGRPEDPFKGRKLPSGRVLYNRLMLYGRNVEKLEVKRRFTTAVPQNIEVRCYSSKLKKLLVARFPEKGDRQTNVKPGNSTEQKWAVKRVSAIDDEKTLKLIAQSVYEAQGRNEIEVRVSTKNLATFGGGNLDPDTLDCQAGDSIDVEVLREPTTAARVSQGTSTASEIEDQIKTRAADYLRELGFDPKVADAYQTAVNDGGVQTTFRVKSVDFNWAYDEGVAVDFTLCNFIEARADKDVPADQQTTPADVANAAAGGNEAVEVVVTDDVGRI